MTFIEWIRENYDYDGDGSYDELSSTFSASELEYMHERYTEET